MNWARYLDLRVCWVGAYWGPHLVGVQVGRVSVDYARKSKPVTISEDEARVRRRRHEGSIFTRRPQG